MARQTFTHQTDRFGRPLVWHACSREERSQSLLRRIPCELFRQWMCDSPRPQRFLRQSRNTSPVSLWMLNGTNSLHWLSSPLGPIDRSHARYRPPSPTFDRASVVTFVAVMSSLRSTRFPVRDWEMNSSYRVALAAASQVKMARRSSTASPLRLGVKPSTGTSGRLLCPTAN